MAETLDSVHHGNICCLVVLYRRPRSSSTRLAYAITLSVLPLWYECSQTAVTGISIHYEFWTKHGKANTGADTSFSFRTLKARSQSRLHWGWSPVSIRCCITPVRPRSDEGTSLNSPKRLASSFLCGLVGFMASRSNCSDTNGLVCCKPVASGWCQSTIFQLAEGTSGSVLVRRAIGAGDVITRTGTMSYLGWPPPGPTRDHVDRQDPEMTQLSVPHCYHTPSNFAGNIISWRSRTTTVSMTGRTKL